MNSDGKIYMKIVAFDEICNFVVQTFFIWSHLLTKKRYTTWIWISNIQILVLYHFLPQYDFKWKSLNYKVIDLVESYNFHINFISIQIHTKSYEFLKMKWTLSPYHTVFAGAVNVVWYGGLPQMPHHMVLQILRLHIFFEKSENKYKNKKIAHLWSFQAH
jgi:hypothetical protein